MIPTKPQDPVERSHSHQGHIWARGLYFENHIV